MSENYSSTDISAFLSLVSRSTTASRADFPSNKTLFTSSTIGISTFIKRFMEMMVLPNIKDENDREIALDEMPQSASGKTIMTTEPKFIPKEGVEIRVDDEIDMRVRLIDCVGYVVDGAEGQTEDGKERMVKTPWYDYDIPFAKIAKASITGHHNPDR